MNQLLSYYGKESGTEYQNHQYDIDARCKDKFRNCLPDTRHGNIHSDKCHRITVTVINRGNHRCDEAIGFIHGNQCPLFRLLLEGCKGNLLATLHIILMIA